MDEEVRCLTLQEYFETLLDNSKGVFSVFCDVFGEDRCDIQINRNFRSEVITIWGDPTVPRPLSYMSGFSLFTRSKVVEIIVYFPEVEISNERDEHHTIKELYVRTSLGINGTVVGKFEMLRTRYTSQELTCGYKHSHAPRVTSEDGLDFTTCCLGTGPITSTLAELTRECDLERWNVYCLQLEQYVGIESIKGGPYIKMNSIGAFIDRESCITYNWDEIIKRGSPEIPFSWITYKFLLTVDMEFAVRDGVLVPTMSALEFALRLTELCKSSSNSSDITYNKGILIGDKLYLQRERFFQVSQIVRKEGRCLIKFKGEEKCLSIDWGEDSHIEVVELVSPAIIYPIIESILVYINTLANEDERKWREVSRFYSVS